MIVNRDGPEVLVRFRPEDEPLVFGMKGRKVCLIRKPGPRDETFYHWYEEKLALEAARKKFAEKPLQFNTFVECSVPRGDRD